MNPRRLRFGRGDRSCGFGRNCDHWSGRNLRVVKRDAAGRGRDDSDTSGAGHGPINLELLFKRHSDRKEFSPSRCFTNQSFQWPRFPARICFQCVFNVPDSVTFCARCEGNRSLSGSCHHRLRCQSRAKLSL